MSKNNRTITFDDITAWMVGEADAETRDAIARELDDPASTTSRHLAWQADPYKHYPQLRQVHVPLPSSVNPDAKEEIPPVSSTSPPPEAELDHAVDKRGQEQQPGIFAFPEPKRPSRWSAGPESQEPPTPGGNHLVQGLTLLAVASVLLAILIPAISAQREAARRAQCVNNLKSLALAAANYESSNGVYPMGIHYQPWYDPAHGCSTSGSYLVALLGDLQRQTAYNAMNFSLNMYAPQNTTVSGIGLAELWCPSDPVINGLTHTYPAGSVTATPLPMYYTSYAANAGIYFQSYGVRAASADAGAACRFEAVPSLDSKGMIYMLSSVNVYSMTDGTSNTMLFSERAHGKLSPQDRVGRNWWTSGTYGDTMFTTFYPMNPFGKLPNYCCLDGGASSYIASASSYHSGLANFAFCDGSVHPIKDTIDSWKIQGTGGTATGLAKGIFSGNGYPEAVSRDPKTKAFISSPATRLGIYQQLSTRNGGEEISPDQY
jgi:prepilin-type processing-associated H-X9-DG protein